MTPAAFRKLCLSLPEAVEAPHMERTSFRIKTRIFATMTTDGTEAMVRVQPVALAHDLIAAKPEFFFSYGGFTDRMGCLGIRLATVSPSHIDGFVREAHALVAAKLAPKRKAAKKKR